MDPIIQKLIAKEIDRALQRNQLPPDSPIRIELQNNAEIGGGYDPEIQVLDESNRVMTLDQRIQELKNDPQFSGYFPPEPPRIRRSDEAKIRANFAKIVSGEVVVE